MKASVTAGPETGSPAERRILSRFLGARVGSTISFQFMTVAVGWQIYALTNSALYLGLVGLAEFLPMFLLTFVVGHVADRYDRRLIVRLCQVVEAVCAIVLAWAALGHWASKESILLTVVVIGAARAFEAPSMQALMPGLVSPGFFPRAAAWSASAMQTASILGPALGGFLYIAGASVVYLGAALLYFASTILVMMIPSPARPIARKAASLRSVFAGISFIWSKPAILGAISLDLFAVLLGGATALLPAFAKDILHTGSWGLGLLRAAPSVGAVVVSLYLTRHPPKARVGAIMFRAVAIFGVATLAFGLSHFFLLSLFCLIVLGGADVISVVIRSSLVQLATPDEMRGRVSAVNSLFIGTSNLLGEFESGLTAAIFGLVPAVLIGGFGTLIVIGLWTRIFPQLLAKDSLKVEDEAISGKAVNSESAKP